MCPPGTPEPGRNTDRMTKHNSDLAGVPEMSHPMPIRSFIELLTLVPLFEAPIIIAGWFYVPIQARPRLRSVATPLVMACCFVIAGFQFHLCATNGVIGIYRNTLGIVLGSELVLFLFILFTLAWRASAMAKSKQIDLMDYVHRKVP